MREHELPTWNDIVVATLAELDRARGGLSESAAWLRSDWQPLGTPLPDGAGQARVRAVDLIGEAKALIDQAKAALYEAKGQTASTE